MSTSDADDVVEVTTGGVTVTKSYTADEFPVPAVRFEFESEHDEPVEVRLAEDIPESFPMDSVGFHPDYHSDQWTAFQDNHVQFVGNVDPDEPLVTVYGIRLSEDTDPGAFLSEPTITVEGDDAAIDADESEDEAELEETMIEDIVGEDSNQVVKDMLSGESESIPGLEDDEGDENDVEVPEEPVAEAADEDLDLQFDEDDDLTGQESEDTDDTVETAAEDEPPADDGSFLEGESLDLELEDVEPEEEATADEPEDEAPDIDLGFDDEEIPAAGEEPAADDGDEETEEAPKIELDLEAAAASADLDSDDEGEAEEDEGAAEGAEPPQAETTDDELQAAEDDVEAVESEDDEGAEDEVSEIESEDGESLEDAEAETDDESDPSITATERQPITAQLATELSEGTAEDDTLETIREHLEVAAPVETATEDTAGTGALEAKVDHLQGRVEEVAAYAGALETFLEEEGTGAQLIEEFREDLSAFESTLERVEADLSETDATVGTLESTTETLESTTATLETDVSAVDEDVSSLEETVESVDNDVGALEDTLESETEALEGAVSDVEEAVETVDAEVDSLEADVTTVADDVEELEDELEDIRDDVVDITEWRDQLGSMFNG